MDFATLSVCHRLRHLQSVLNPPQRSAGFSQKNATGLGEPHGLRAVVEQRHAQFIFEVANLPAQWWLRNAKPRGCACHVLFFSDGDEIAQVAQFHSAQHTELIWLAKQQGISLSPRREDMLDAWIKTRNAQVASREPGILLDAGLQKTAVNNFFPSGIARSRDRINLNDAMRPVIGNVLVKFPTRAAMNADARR